MHGVRAMLKSALDYIAHQPQHITRPHHVSKSASPVPSLTIISTTIQVSVFLCLFVELLLWLCSCVTLVLLIVHVFSLVFPVWVYVSTFHYFGYLSALPLNKICTCIRCLLQYMTHGIFPKCHTLAFLVFFPPPRMVSVIFLHNVKMYSVSPLAGDRPRTDQHFIYSV